ncbi:MAG TPA: SRPBCC family protein [Thermoanaerobaculia bacterium]|nr:SRPBCC family protein [Thermoanaerobaculia bacterium]
MSTYNNEEQSYESPTKRNVSDPERWLSVVAGSALAVYGLKRRDIPGIVAGVLGGALVWRGASGHCMVYGSLGLTTVDDSGDQVSVPYGRGVRVEKAVTINASPEQLYSFWRNFQNLPRFMHNLESVEVHDTTHSRWTARGPAGSKVSWEAVIHNEVPNELIGWRSVDGSTIDNAGSVHFTPAPGGRGTQVKVVLRYDPPAGKLGAAVSKLLGEDPAMQVQEDLRRLKMLIETGELATNESPSGRESR